MCGIAGIVRPGQSVTVDEIRTMAAAIKHRGPDEAGEYLGTGVGLGVQRLKVIDLETGSQPVTNEDRTVWAVFNGEIYNFQSLRQSLEARGHRFASSSDTECIVHAYEEYGDDCLNHFRGMFAFALWDARRQRLLLARDRFGKKPLLYAHLAGELYFASEFQALTALPSMPRAIDWGAFGDYLAYGYVPAPASFFRDIRKLEPGHRLTFEAGQLAIERYWCLQYGPKLRISEPEALEELERLLSEAVRLRMISDVPLGALLSGGVDSSLIVALMARQSSSRVKTFTIGFDDEAYDEKQHAGRVARLYDTEHHELIVRPNAAEVLPQLIRHYGEPFADSSAVPTFYVSQLASQHVTVAVNGDGGDELFAGYDRYRAMWLGEAVQVTPLAKPAARLASKLIGRTPGLSTRVRRRSQRLLWGAVLPAQSRYCRWMDPAWPLLGGWQPALGQDDLWCGIELRLLEPELAATIHSQRAGAVERALAGNRRLGLTDRLLATDVATYLPGDLLVKADIASMANSLELRSPLLDHVVAEFAARLPSNLKLRYGVQQKYLLKKLAQGLVPGENIDRPKMGFSVPIGSWLRGPLKSMAADVLFSQRARQRGYFQMDALDQVWSEHQCNRADHTYALWILLMLELWHLEFLDGARPELAPSKVVAA